MENQEKNLMEVIVDAIQYRLNDAKITHGDPKSAQGYHQVYMECNKGYIDIHVNHSIGTVSILNQAEFSIQIGRSGTDMCLEEGCRSRGEFVTCNGYQDAIDCFLACSNWYTKQDAQ